MYSKFGRYEKQFGEELAQCSSKDSQVVLRRFLAYMLILGGIAMGIYMLTIAVAQFKSPFQVIIVFFAIIFSISFPSFILLNAVRRFDAVIYENGLVLNLGKKLYELNFNELAGISDNVLIRIPIGKKSITNIGSYSSSKGVTLELSSGKMISANNLFAPNIKEFYNALNNAYSTWLVKDLTTDNIKQTKILFGTGLSFAEGKIYCNGKTIALDNVLKVSIEDNSLILAGINDSDQVTRFASVPLNGIINLDALKYIIENFGYKPA